MFFSISIDYINIESIVLYRKYRSKYFYDTGTKLVLNQISFKTKKNLVFEGFRDFSFKKSQNYKHGGLDLFRSCFDFVSTPPSSLESLDRDREICRDIWLTK
jgi:hypothetical protein